MRKKAVVAAVIGNFIERYDFTIYGCLAIVLAPLFFPTEDRLVSLMATFAVFGVAFVLRPVGALFFGSIGDRIGRRRTLSAVILIASGATFLIGLLPSYETIGILTPLLLVVARMVQGFAVGGEFGGATAFMFEYAPEGWRLRETTVGELASMLLCPFAGLRAVALDPLPGVLGRRWAAELLSVKRENFVRTLLGTPVVGEASRHHRPWRAS